MSKESMRYERDHQEQDKKPAAEGNNNDSSKTVLQNLSEAQEKTVEALRQINAEVESIKTQLNYEKSARVDFETKQEKRFSDFEEKEKKSRSDFQKKIQTESASQQKTKSKKAGSAENDMIELVLSGKNHYRLVFGSVNPGTVISSDNVVTLYLEHQASRYKLIFE